MTTRYHSLYEAADHFGVTVRTVRNWASEGRFNLYELPGGRAKRVRISEIEEAVRIVPTAHR